MFVKHLSLADFRSYERAELTLGPGTSTLVGLNGQGKTNLVEAIGYLATLSSHRVATDAPLVRYGAQRAVVRGVVVRDGRESTIELEITPGKANRARLNRSALTRPRDVLGAVRTVLFAPEDLALVKGDPAERRRFLDQLLITRQPRWAAVRGDYDRILTQRNTLLKQAQPLLSPGRGKVRRRAEGVQEEAERASALHTLHVWNTQLADVAAPLLYARLRLVRDLRPLLQSAYCELSGGVSQAQLTYRASLRAPSVAEIEAGEVPAIEDLHAALLATLDEVAEQEVERGVTLVGPHRDDLVLSLGDLPAKGYASHGECWTFALALKLAAYQVLRHDLRDDPVLLLDDVFAELDTGRRERLAALVADCEQVLVTAAVAEDIPQALRGPRYAVTLGSVDAGSERDVQAGADDG